MQAEVVCGSVFPDQGGLAINEKIGKLLTKGYEPVKMAGTVDRDIGKMCVLLVKKE